MARDKIEISVQEEIRNVTRAMRRVTSAAFAGNPGLASRIKGKRKSAQFTFKADSRKKRDIQSVARRKLAARIFRREAVRLERAIKNALKAVIIGLSGSATPSVKVMGRTLGVAKSSRPIDREGFVKFIKTKRGAGEIGLPDPEEAVRNLKNAIIESISIDVVVRSTGPQVKFTFDQNRLLKLTPHPDVFEGGPSGPFFSWLSLITGPDMVKSLSGFSLVRVADIRSKLTSTRSAIRGGRRQPGSARALTGLIQISRTRGNAGDQAAVMLSNRRRGNRQSPAEFAGGNNQEYAPKRRFTGFWDEWWLSTKIDLGNWSRRIMFAAVRELMKKGR